MPAAVVWALTDTAVRSSPRGIARASAHYALAVLVTVPRTRYRVLHIYALEQWLRRRVALIGRAHSSR
eukprot:4729737-Pyramimonas_sp.AAC.1